MIKEFQISEKLKDNLSVLKRLYGDEWASASKPYRDELTRLMSEYKTDNVLSVAVNVGKKLVAEGASPLMLLGVATDMCLDGQS